MEITESTAKRLHEESPWFREELENEFGKDLFVKQVFEEIKTFDDACKACGTTEEAFNAKFAHLDLDVDTIAFEKLKLINRAINKDWTPDYSNSEQLKWFPYFILSSGFGFSASGCCCVSANASVGSHLCFKTEGQADWSGSQFRDVWKAFITNKL